MNFLVSFLVEIFFVLPVSLRSEKHFFFKINSTGTYFSGSLHWREDKELKPQTGGGVSSCKHLFGGRESKMMLNCRQKKCTVCKKALTSFTIHLQKTHTSKLNKAKKPGGKLKKDFTGKTYNQKFKKIPKYQELLTFFSWPSARICWNTSKKWSRVFDKTISIYTVFWKQSVPKTKPHSKAKNSNKLTWKFK